MKMLLLKHHYLLITLLFAAFLSFIKLGEQPISIFDEARNGVIAMEMLENKDWVNLHFGGKPDEWIVKPPLFIWTLVLSFKYFGLHIFSLRLPSAIATVFSFFLIFKMIKLYHSEEFAFYTCLLLMSVKGIIGFHVGRTGDFDALLLCFLLGAVFCFVKAVDFDRPNFIYGSAIFFGFAFLTKGFAMGIYVPGILIYLFLRAKFASFLKQKRNYLALLLFLLFPLAWFLMIQYYGLTHSGAFRGNDAFQSMFWYDIVDRFTSANFEGESSTFYLLSIFPTLDSRFNLWNYFLFLMIGLSVFHRYKTKKKVDFKNHPLFLLSIAFAVPICLFLNFTMAQRSWYIAPAIPFIGIITYYLFDRLKAIYPGLKFVFFGLLAFTMIRQSYQLIHLQAQPKIISDNKQTLEKAEAILKAGTTEWDHAHMLLHLLFLNRNVEYDDRKLKREEKERTIIFAREKYLEALKKENPKYELEAIGDGYVMLKKIE